MKCSTCGKDVPPVAAIDIDGTLGNYHAHFVIFASAYLGIDLPMEYDGSMPFNEYLGLEKKLYRDIKLAYRQGGLKRTMTTYTGAEWFMQELRQNGVEIWICSTRPYLRLDNVDPDTRHWLERNDMPYDFMLYGDDKWEQLEKNVDRKRVIAVVDDLSESLQDAKSRGFENWWQPKRYHNRGAILDEERTFVHLSTLFKYKIAPKIDEWRSR